MVAGFSLRPGVAACADQRKRRERLRRFISRPAVAEQRLSVTSNSNVRYRLKTPYRDGSTRVVFATLATIARLAALVPKPCVSLTRFHGGFASNSGYGGRVTPGKPGTGGQCAATQGREAPTPVERRAAMTWAQHLKRVFGTDVETCRACGGAVRIIACIDGPDVIERVLVYLAAKAAGPEAPKPPRCRAPPQASLFDRSIRRVTHCLAA